MGKTRLQTRLKLNGIVPYFCALWTPIRPIGEVNKKKRGLEPTETKANIQEWGLEFSGAMFDVFEWLVQPQAVLFIL